MEMIVVSMILPGGNLQGISYRCWLSSADDGTFWRGIDFLIGDASFNNIGSKLIQGCKTNLYLLALFHATMDIYFEVHFLYRSPPFPLPDSLRYALRKPQPKEKRKTRNKKRRSKNEKRKTKNKKQKTKNKKRNKKRQAFPPPPLPRPSPPTPTSA